MLESRSTGESARASVPYPPPLTFVAGFLLGLGMQRVSPQPLVRSDGGVDALSAASHALLAVAAALVLTAIAAFRRARTTPGFHRPSASLIVAGPFRLSRNPLYLAAAILHVGLALRANAVWPLVMFVPAIVVVDALIRREETYLTRRFGAEYEAYRQRVRRWL